MAPEVIMTANGYNLAVDIWSLGCTILEMATLKAPWSQYEGRECSTKSEYVFCLFPYVQVPRGNLELVLMGTILSSLPIRCIWQLILVLIFTQFILPKLPSVKQVDQLKPYQMFIFSSSKPLVDHQE